MTRRKGTEPRLDFRSELRNLWRGVAEQCAHGRGVFLLPYPTAKSFHKRQVGSRGFVLVTSASKNHSAIERSLDRKFTRETTLAGSRFATEEHGMPMPLTRATPQLASFGQLGGATDHASTRERIQNRNCIRSLAFIDRWSCDE